MESVFNSTVNILETPLHFILIHKYASPIWKFVKHMYVLIFRPFSIAILIIPARDKLDPYKEALLLC